MKQMRMTKQEVKDEHRQSEGDPQIKAQIRKLRVQRARQRMMAAIPSADVVITNPTHFAVALQYDMVGMPAPKVVAKGVDSLAFRIREVAEAHEIPIVEDPPLARALYASVELDEHIPPGTLQGGGRNHRLRHALAGRIRGRAITPPTWWAELWPKTNATRPSPGGTPKPFRRPDGAESRRSRWWRLKAGNRAWLVRGGPWGGGRGGRRDRRAGGRRVLRRARVGLGLPGGGHGFAVRHGLDAGPFARRQPGRRPAAARRRNQSRRPPDHRSGRRVPVHQPGLPAPVRHGDIAGRHRVADRRRTFGRRVQAPARRGVGRGWRPRPSCRSGSPRTRSNGARSAFSRCPTCRATRCGGSRTSPRGARWTRCATARRTPWPTCSTAFRPGSSRPIRTAASSTPTRPWPTGSASRPRSCARGGGASPTSSSGRGSRAPSSATTTPPTR